MYIHRGEINRDQKPKRGGTVIYTNQKNENLIHRPSPEKKKKKKRANKILFLRPLVLWQLQRPNPKLYAIKYNPYMFLLVSTILLHIYINTDPSYTKIKPASLIVAVDHNSSISIPYTY